MKQCKRMIYAVLALLMVLGSLSGCNGTAEPGNETQAPDSPQPLERGYYLAEDYLADPELFVPAWQGQFEVPAEMLDWEEKFQQFFTPNGRLMSVAHRGDRNDLYPENSVEGILSVIYAGVDMIEIDVIKTKDGIPIVFHDDDLLRTTNLTLMRLDGQAGGLPESNLVADWTLEEIRQLRLTMETGEVTNYVVPTLEDVLLVAKGRVFVMLDKFKRFDWSTDIAPIIEKTGALETVVMPYSYSVAPGMETTSFFMKRLENGGARDVAMACQVTPDTIAQVAQDIVTNQFPMALRCGEYVPGDPAISVVYGAYAGEYRMYFEVLDRENDNLEVWKEMEQQGFNVIMSNTKAYELCQYIAQTYFAN